MQAISSHLVPDFLAEATPHGNPVAEMHLMIIISFSLLLTSARIRAEGDAVSPEPEREESAADENLRKNLTDLSDKYEALCQEMRLISQHVVFLEQALSDLSQHGDVLYRKKREISSEIENHVAAQTLEKTESPVTGSPDADAVTGASMQLSTAAPDPVTEDDSLIVVRAGEAVSAVTEASSESREEGTAPDQESKCGCNLLHQYSCPIDKSKSFDNQFNDWYHNLLFSMSQNCSRGAQEFAKRKHRSKHRHHNRHHHRQHRNIRHGNNSVDQGPVAMNPSQIDQMEQTLIEDDTVYATCDVIPNRHISLILQQNVKGKINLWQRGDGHGAMHAHVQLCGFRVTAGERRRRETILMPVETSSETAGSPALSLEHGFHVHMAGDLSRSCQSTGTHFNPTNSSHGGPMDSVRHAGDLGNIRVDERGCIDAEYSYPYVSLVGQHSIIGKSLVVSPVTDAQIVHRILRPTDSCASGRL